MFFHTTFTQDGRHDFARFYTREELAAVAHPEYLRQRLEHTRQDGVAPREDEFGKWFFVPHGSLADRRTATFDTFESAATAAGESPVRRDSRFRVGVVTVSGVLHAGDISEIAG